MLDPLYLTKANQGALKPVLEEYSYKKKLSKMNGEVGTALSTSLACTILANNIRDVLLFSLLYIIDGYET